MNATKLLNTGSLIILMSVNIYALITNFLLVSKNYDYYSDLIPDAWHLFIFPTLMAVLFLISVGLLIAKSRWAYFFLVLPLLCYFLIDMLNLSMSFIDTSAIDAKNQADIEYQLNQNQIEENSSTLY